MEVKIYSLFSGVLSAGIWPALPLTGYVVYKRYKPLCGIDSFPRFSSFALMSAAGIAVWSVPMLVAAMLGAYHATYFGLIGWIITVFSLTFLYKKKQLYFLRNPGASRWDFILVAGITLVTVFNLLFPTESMVINRDEGIYTNHGVYISNHGRMDIPYPWPAEDNDVFTGASQEFHGFYQTQPTLTAPYAHLFPVWLAQAYSTLGHHGLFRFNALVAALSFGIFYGFCRSVMPVAYAVAATFFLAFNPSEIWISRVNLTENLAQLFIWSGLFLFSYALKNNDKKMARWAGLFLGASTLVRIDSFILLPLLIIAHLAQRISEGQKDEKSSSIWSALYQVILPLFVVSVSYYIIDSKTYFLELLPFWRKIVLSAVLAFILLISATERVLKTVSPLATNRAALFAVGVILILFSGYFYYVRPISALWNGFSDVIKEYRGVAYGFRGVSFADFSLVNLSQYLSPFVVFSALLGWFVMYHSAMRRGENRFLLPLVAVFAGYACAYLWDPSISPGHFWSIRRFVPVIIPGFVFFAALGMIWMFDLFPKKLSIVAAGIILVFLIGFTVKADKLIFSFSENKGFFSQLRELAKKLPDDEIIIAQGNTSWFLPLYLSFDRHIVLMHLSLEGDKEVFYRWISHQSGNNRPVYLLYEGSFQSADLQYHHEFDSVFKRSISEITFFPLPKKIKTEESDVGVYKIYSVSKAL
jgi:hypothetical protein